MRKFFESFPDEPLSTSCSAVGQITCAVINTNVHQMRLSACYCGKFEFILFFKNFRKVLCWQHCKYIFTLSSNVVSSSE